MSWPGIQTSKCGNTGRDSLVEVRKMVQILEKEHHNVNSQGWIQLLYFVSELMVQTPCYSERNKPCRPIHLTSLNSLQEVHIQLTHLKMLILRGDEFYSYIAKGVFQKAYLIGGLEFGRFKAFIST